VESRGTQENVEMLRVRGVKIVDPDEGYLACGMTGAGRLAGQAASLPPYTKRCTPFATSPVKTSW